MKKILFMAVITAAVFTGCSQDEEIEKREASVVNFKAITGKSTRATETVAANFLNFKVFAYETANTSSTLPGTGVTPSFMYGLDVTRTSSTDPWGYTGDTYYWPSSNNVHFFSYSPASSTAAAYATAQGVEGQPIINYTVPTTVAAQEDLIYARAEGQNRTSPGTNPVQLAFSHALSQLVFKAKSGVSTLKFDITEMQLINVKNQSSLNLKNGNWTTPTGSVDYTLPTALMAATALDIDNSAFVDITGTNGAMMIMPQALTAGQYAGQNYVPGDRTSGTFLRIVFGAKNAATDTEVVAPGTTLTVPFGGFTLAKNNKYTIEMTLTGTSDGGDTRVAISFNGTVSPWDEPGSSTPINM